MSPTNFPSRCSRWWNLPLDGVYHQAAGYVRYRREADIGPQHIAVFLPGQGAGGSPPRRLSPPPPIYFRQPRPRLGRETPSRAYPRTFARGYDVPVVGNDAHPGGGGANWKVRMGKKDVAWIALKKKRGGQPGNRNRRLHGRYSADTIARHAAIRALIRRCDAAAASVAARAG